MAIYRYIVTVETFSGSPQFMDVIAEEIDNTLEKNLGHHGLEHFTVEQAPVGYWPGRGFIESSLGRPAPLSPDGRYND